MKQNAVQLEYCYTEAKTFCIPGLILIKLWSKFAISFILLKNEALLRKFTRTYIGQLLILNFVISKFCNQNYKIQKTCPFTQQKKPVLKTQTDPTMLANL